MQMHTTWRTGVTTLTCNRTPLLKRPRCALFCNAGQLLVSHTLAKARHDTRQRPSGTERKLEETVVVLNISVALLPDPGAWAKLPPSRQQFTQNVEVLSLAATSGSVDGLPP